MRDSRLFKIPLVLESQPEGGFSVTSPALPELITEGDSLSDALENVRDALAAVLEIYQEQGRDLPAEIIPRPGRSPLRLK